MVARHSKGDTMLGDVIEISEGLWLVEGEMPDDNDRYPDAANAIVYRQDDRLYIIDTGVGPLMRASLLRLLRENGSVREFTLLNSHGHIDHVCSNDSAKNATLTAHTDRASHAAARALILRTPRSCFLVSSVTTPLYRTIVSQALRGPVRSGKVKGLLRITVLRTRVNKGQVEEGASA
jgi:glyoxylase-like metal-dependent hydrolase (beta-lactamase superfamily II)